MIEAPPHLFCSEECQRRVERTDFDCFDDGCQYECCACGRCAQPDSCPETGQGHTWHQ